MQFWANVYSMETASNECLSKVRSILSCASTITIARSFQGNEAQTLIDFLNRVSTLSTACLDNLRRKHRFLCGRASITNSGSGVYGSFPRSAKHAGSYPPLILFDRSLYASGGFVTTVCLQMCTMENTRNAP
ncbi:hypothetical protein BDM02DRAFT_2520842 [Thelephora ganbajun]|uniref:Uncharacterized protein n=1 Tax=Thelephora ganbajun TaxID=370292 RepID=A0ACB6ZDR9_THEGA|nr:hypothetical protein BDM02DRAFT_2520842 [Thelephora ganbajun]